MKWFVIVTVPLVIAAILQSGEPGDYSGKPGSFQRETVRMIPETLMGQTGGDAGINCQGYAGSASLLENDNILLTKNIVVCIF